MSAKILIVDDVAMNVRLLTAKLRSEYFQVDVAVDGFQALDKASSWQPDVILLDVMMPGMDGYACCKALKSNVMTRHIPVIMITALGELDERVKGLESGADEFLTKPVDYSALIIRLKNLIRQKRVLDEWRARGDTALAFGLEHIAIRDFSKQAISVLLYATDEAVIKRLTKKLEGYACTSACNVTDLEARLRSENLPDLLILMMPYADVDPLHLISSIRSNPHTHQVPIILVSDSVCDHSTLSKAFDLGVNDCLFNSSDYSELLARCRNLILRSFYQRRLREQVDRAIELVAIDPLTRLFNRRYLEKHLDILYRLNNGFGLCVLLIDVDHFKAINDRYGHSFGDYVLRCVAKALAENTRAFDTVSRYGGEEFVVVLPSTTLDEASLIAKRLLASISGLKDDLLTAHSQQITASIGVASRNLIPASPQSLLDSADQALYRAKANGRNRIEMEMV